MIHVIPNNDLQEHEETTVCKCDPVVIWECHDFIAIHNAFDGREGLETTNELLNNNCMNKDDIQHHEEKNNIYKFYEDKIFQLQQTLKEKDEALKYCHKRMGEAYSEIHKLQQLLSEKEKEIERLKLELELHEQRDNDPYWYWPQCDVEECEGVSCNGGGAWRETGYWSVCSKHSNEFREGKPQPKMKQAAIEREASRDKETGYLPSVTESLKQQKP